MSPHVTISQSPSILSTLNGTMTTKIHTFKTSDTRSAAEYTIQATKLFTNSPQTVELLNGKTLAPLSVVTTTGDPGLASSSTVSTQTLGLLSVVTTTEDPSSASEGTVQETKSSTVSPQTLAPSSVVTTTEDPGSASDETVQETQSSTASLQTLGRVNGKTHTPSLIVTTSLQSTKTLNHSQSEVHVYSTILLSRSSTSEQTKDPVSTFKKIISHTNLAPSESGTSILSLDQKLSISKTCDTSTVAGSGLVINTCILTSPTLSTPTMSHTFQAAVYPPRKPSSNMPNEIQTVPGSNDKDVSSPVNPTSISKDIVSNQQDG